MKNKLEKALSKIGKTFIIPSAYAGMIKKFHEIDHKCHLLSKEYPYSKEEILNMVINKSKTTTMDIEQAFYFISGELSAGCIR